jgi:hypothetical protein
VSGLAPDSDEAWGETVLVWNGLVAGIPALVVRPSSSEELAAAVAFARDHALSLRVQGLTASGDATPVERCLTLDLSGVLARCTDVDAPPTHSPLAICKGGVDQAAWPSWQGHEATGWPEGGAMHARIVRYTYTGDATALARQAEDGLLPILQSQPGFKAYSVIESDGEIISFSAWESAENAESANDAAASWVAENMAGIIELKQAWIGEILISTLLGVSTKAGITA